MREAKLSEKLPGSRVRCHTCQWRCTIAPSKSGVCRMYQNKDGVLYNRSYAKTSSVAADPIEKKPLFHFFPGSLAFSIGGWGCNFHCQHCQNWEISCPRAGKPWRSSSEIQPETSIAMAKYYHCQGIAWTYNEPTVWFEYTLDSARLAKEHNLYTVYVTNGYMTPEAMDTIGPYLDAWRVDIKGFSDAFYRELAKIPRWRGILEVAQRAKDKWHMHVEVITNIIPTMNDDDQQLEGIANWIKDELGELTPWHVTRFYPHHHLGHLPPTPVATLEHAYEIGRKAGLKFIYTGNVPSLRSENTTCYACGQLVVQRFGYQTSVVSLNGSKCKNCGAELNFRTPERESK
ncbi:MAG: AmmeMemoRadiSam system radical SAM enzyme [Dehalococcoidales bacterium]|jgi:pyruvate formate lyase activating enzyme|nr:AmmeMemoRadiSam system radical SAM enzyme [Dehalococcoidales bacterium]MDP6577371.1 AmmeMemoRadiSam system radical SAM enzyme [Dehalococcoidales bacterium]MDP6825076.1 AmmeMemoRadiSam system radical SAM enzyme [Dehalococcoidales bacterium]